MSIAGANRAQQCRRRGNGGQADDALAVGSKGFLTKLVQLLIPARKAPPYASPTANATITPAREDPPSRDYGEVKREALQGASVGGRGSQNEPKRNGRVSPRRPTTLKQHTQRLHVDPALQQLRHAVAVMGSSVARPHIAKRAAATGRNAAVFARPVRFSWRFPACVRDSCLELSPAVPRLTSSSGAPGDSSFSATRSVCHPASSMIAIASPTAPSQACVRNCTRV
ncbi:hypothetical protein SNOG_02758 [Parastagonospora nodorum SN15]|uniref:Uncharacterized protein n=1 Tax=Phaeosphaeria nodorum (strain SN15 / ATCC MYA-4574 / FGSC 10173) TaxID=321614 RepID=Q0UZQ6_PHANO|nr:hypothetical protein SNOG_02758 [Parastagonospora nodorum SN15]EAT89489.1 hypothetical protein SNOG_02758 [Parastagonospora nodorum SN15]